MLWRLWSFVSGLPLGAFAAIASSSDAGVAAARAPWGAAVGGLLLVLVTSLLARRRDDAPDRGRHLAMAASAGWLAVPAAAAWWLGFAPGSPWWIGACALVLAMTLWRGMHAIGPAGGPVRQVLGAAGWIASGTVAALAIGTGWALAGPAGPVPPTPRLANAIYDLDAAVATRPLPSCAPVPSAVRTLREAGAHPSLSPDGRFLWFDAPASEPAGARQVHRLERASGTVECWTCGEPGDNVRPQAGDSGLALVFESNREATWLHPDDTEIFLSGTARRGSSRRLTFRAGPDERPVLGPGSRWVVWSRREAGRYQVVSAALRTGHGGILLGNVAVLASGGAAWMAPLGWAPDGRTLALGRGNPFAPVTGLVVDPASGAVTVFAENLAPAAAFDADGGWWAFPTAQGGHWVGALPSALGFALGPWAHARSRESPLLHGTGVRSGSAAEPAAARALELPSELATWGAPTGIALDPDGHGLILGQRREVGGRVEERLVEISLACDGTAFAGSAGSSR